MRLRNSLVSSTHGRRVAAVLSLLLVAIAWVTLPAAEAGRRRSPDFPAPLVAPVLAPPSLPPELRVAAIYADTDESAGLDPVVVVEFDESFELPETDYRISVYAGAPEGDQVRASLRSSGGDEEGTIEVGDGTSFEDVRPIDARFDGQSARLTIPGDDIGDSGSLWAEVELTGQAPFVTPLFPLDDVLNRGEVGRIGADDVVWAPDGLPASLPASPTLAVDGETLTLTYSAAPPTEVAGTRLSNVVDVVRVASSYEDGGQARYQIAVDNAAGQVVLFDTRDGFPVAIPADPATWLVKGLDGRPAEAGTTIEVDLEGVFEAFAFTPTDEGTALGVARSLTVDAATAIRADGAVATLGWFQGLEASTSPTIAERSDASSAAEPAEQSDSSGFPILLLGAIVVILGIAVVAWLLVRRGPRATEEPARLRMPMAKREEPIIEPVEVTPDERNELDRLTHDLFGDSGGNETGDHAPISRQDTPTDAT
jgi:hypothetical protein